ncbi:hypothetical protein [Microbacterium sp. SSM24]|uniref:hypothetical protein n=1 Tax=Microbacterium sp. SSM24 TaxID=2991714 RepID=UPI002225B8EF|nr:hypothetical protein [Microbacterium sp. SSM24]MCW3494364.1 hypothetical protein [Microbacterium sp. SSM24]
MSLLRVLWREAEARNEVATAPTIATSPLRIRVLTFRLAAIRAEVEGRAVDVTQ